MDQQCKKILFKTIEKNLELTTSVRKRRLQKSISATNESVTPTYYDEYLSNEEELQVTKSENLRTYSTRNRNILSPAIIDENAQINLSQLPSPHLFKNFRTSEKENCEKIPRYVHREKYLFGRRLH